MCEPRCAVCTRLPIHHQPSLPCLGAEGAQRIYIEGLRPWLLKYQPVLDQGLAALLHALRRPELAALGEALHQLASRTPVLECEWREGGAAQRAHRGTPALPCRGLACCMLL